MAIWHGLAVWPNGPTTVCPYGSRMAKAQTHRMPKLWAFVILDFQQFLERLRILSDLSGVVWNCLKRFRIFGCNRVLTVDFAEGLQTWSCAPHCNLDQPQSHAPQTSHSPSSFFVSGPLDSIGLLYGWGMPPLSAPGAGTQSWLLCPLISLGLAHAKQATGTPLWSTGGRDPVPDVQINFCTQQCILLVAPDLFSFGIDSQ